MKKEINEMCPHCNQEATVMHDIDTQGYETTCPYCNKSLMLCSMCMGAKDNKKYKCDWNKATKTCFRRVRA